MSKNKKNQNTSENQITEKKNVSFLEWIRTHPTLVVGIIGVPLIIFILENFFGFGQTLFGGDVMNVGKINGKKIDRNEFAQRVENQVNMYRQNSGKEIDDNTRSQIVDYVWNQYVSEYAIKPQYEKIGIIVGADELYQNVIVAPAQSVLQRISDQKTGKIIEQFARPDGSLDVNKWKNAIQNIQGDQEMAVKQMEEEVRQMRIAQKYSALISKAVYVTSAEAKHILAEQTTTANVSYVMKRFDAVSDSAVKVTENDIEKYYKENSYEFNNPEATRSLEFISFNVVPSAKDLEDIQKDAVRTAEGFKSQKTLSEDSTFIQQESENGAITIQDFTHKTMIVRDSSIYTSPIGSVFGPYNEGAYFKIYKLEKIQNLADSCRVRHILVGITDPQTNQPKRTLAQAKRQADSLITLIKEKKVTFDTLVKTFSDDFGSRDKGGDYGWFDENKGFVEPFKMAGLTGEKGNITAVQTQFGYHIIEVLDVSKTHHESYKIAQIFKLITPSDETNQQTFAKASEFAGQHNTGELFDKGVEKEKLTKRIADNVRESDRMFPGVESAKEIVRWAYTANTGDVSVFSLPDKHVVVKLAAIKNKGTLPLDVVKNEVKAKVIIQKKAEMFSNEFKNAGTSPEQIAGKLNLQVQTQEKFVLASHNIEGVGHDDILVGTIVGLKNGATSKIVTGENGVFVAKVNSLAENTQQQDFKMMQAQIMQSSAYKAESAIFNALKELANIEDHKSKID
ncbi:MAG: SurA N-terminal domain-containing protein [Bacteroidetes bacterium]|nr:SurA N-terminal domain-containing protein [Bacteroidota bacterium]